MVSLLPFINSLAQKEILRKLTDNKGVAGTPGHYDSFFTLGQKLHVPQTVCPLTKGLAEFVYSTESNPPDNPKHSWPAPSSQPALELGTGPPLIPSILIV